MVAAHADGGVRAAAARAQTKTAATKGMLFDVNAPLDYYVEADGVRSPIYTLKVVDVPYVQRLELEYRFPAYTGLEPQKIEDGGDIAVLRGTEVRVHVFPTMKTPGGRLALNDKESRGAGAAGRRHADGAASRPTSDGFYHVELEAPNGEHVAASPQYTIDVLDRPARRRCRSASRAATRTASPIEEVFVEAQAEDDFGVRDLELVYSVNGGAEKMVKLFGGAQAAAGSHAPATRSISKSSACSRATRCRTTRARSTTTRSAAPSAATSDLYFLRVRPFKQGLPPGAVAGRRRWRRRWWRRRPGRGAVRAAAADHLGDLQRAARSQEA